MKINENIKIVGRKVILVPYEVKHVEKYHNWMQDPELQELTASEPLSLQEEYEMQKTWRNDEDKQKTMYEVDTLVVLLLKECTFLIMSRIIYEQTLDENLSLIGDTNLFLQRDNDGNKIAEAEIMVAEKSSRSQGFGWESMLLMMKYGQKYLNIEKFLVKINETNTKSINMFKKMKFIEISKSEVFKEITLDRTINENWIKWLDINIELNIENYR